MIVCHCRGVTERKILEVIRDGCCSPGAVAKACGAGTSCGGCMPLVCEIVDNELDARTNLEAEALGTGLLRAS